MGKDIFIQSALSKESLAEQKRVQAKKDIIELDLELQLRRAEKEGRIPKK